MASIENMMKVKVSIRAGSAEEKYDLVSEPVLFEFIFGAGSEGLCTFESRLFNRKVGESVNFSVTAAELHETFGHLRRDLLTCLGLTQKQCPLFFEFGVEEIVAADNRELVQSIARAVASGGCGGGCDCGCG